MKKTIVCRVIERTARSAGPGIMLERFRLVELTDKDAPFGEYHEINFYFYFLYNSFRKMTRIVDMKCTVTFHDLDEIFFDSPFLARAFYDTLNHVTVSNVVIKKHITLNNLLIVKSCDDFKGQFFKINHHYKLVYNTLLNLFNLLFDTFIKNNNQKIIVTFDYDENKMEEVKNAADD